MDNRDKSKMHSLVALKADPKIQGRILEIRRRGKIALIKFDEYHRITVHAMKGLIILSDSSQLPLFTGNSKTEKSERARRQQ